MWSFLAELLWNSLDICDFPLLLQPQRRLSCFWAPFIWANLFIHQCWHRKLTDAFRYIYSSLNSYGCIWENLLLLDATGVKLYPFNWEVGLLDCFSIYVYSYSLSLTWSKIAIFIWQKYVNFLLNDNNMYLRRDLNFCKTSGFLHISHKASDQWNTWSKIWTCLIKICQKGVEGFPPRFL